MKTKPKWVRKANMFVTTEWNEDPNKKGTKFKQEWFSKEELCSE